MGRRQQKGVREGAGGIVSLAKFTLEHREAIEYDLLTGTGHELKDIGNTLSWDAFDSFLQKLDLHSALFRDTHPEIAVWAEPIKTNAILADIYDVLAGINANLVAIGSGKQAKRPKPYQRPVKMEHNDEKRFGSGALPVNELHEWIERKRAEFNARNSTSHDNSHSGPERRTAEDNGRPV